jgi:hypothetical protein
MFNQITFGKNHTEQKSVFNNTKAFQETRGYAYQIFSLQTVSTRLKCTYFSSTSTVDTKDREENNSKSLTRVH